MVHEGPLPPAELVLRYVPVEWVSHGRQDRLAALLLGYVPTGAVLRFLVDQGSIAALANPKPLQQPPRSRGKHPGAPAPGVNARKNIGDKRAAGLGHVN